jgi:hypothetical protein
MKHKESGAPAVAGARRGVAPDFSFSSILGDRSWEDATTVLPEDEDAPTAKIAGARAIVLASSAADDEAIPILLVRRKTSETISTSLPRRSQKR